MRTDQISNNSLTPLTKGPIKATADAGTAPDNPLDTLGGSDSFAHKPIFDLSSKNLKSLAKRGLVEAAFAAGIMALSGGSALAVLGLSVAAGAVRGAVGAFLSNLNFDGPGTSSNTEFGSLDKSLTFRSALGAAKGTVKGAILGALKATGFGVIGGTVAGALMPAAGQVVAKAFDAYQHHKYIHNGYGH